MEGNHWFSTYPLKIGIALKTKEVDNSSVFTARLPGSCDNATDINFKYIKN
jgi:hypothetical protein